VAQPQITKTKWNPQQGGLLSDIDPKEIGGGNLLVTGVNSGAMNMRNVGKGLNVMPDYEPVYGNELVYSLTPAVAQNKKWRIYADVTNVPAVTGTDLIVNGDFATNLNDWVVDPSTAPTWSWSGGTALKAAGGPAQLSQLIQLGYHGTYSLTFDVIGMTPGGNLSVTTTSTGTSTVVIDSNITSNGNYVYTFDSNKSDSFTLNFFGNNPFDGAIDNVTLTLVNYLYSFDYDITNPTGTSLLSGSSSYREYDDIGLTLTSIESFINTDFTSFLPSTNQVITGSYTGYVEFELAYAPYFNYILALSNGYSSYGTSELIIVQEAIDSGCTGEWHLIGSDDRTGYSFQFWTTRTGLPQTIEVFNITDNGSGAIRVTTIESHNILNDQSVDISLVNGAIEANGVWTVSVVDGFNFDLYNSTYVSPYVSGGVVTFDICGLGEIGVAVKDDEGVISYTRLLRSNEFNFSTLKQIDVRVKRKQDSRFAAYYTDNYNVPRVFYYKGEFIQDGALNYIVSDNIYEYGNIASESRWLINNEDFYIDVIGQEQSGGELKSGNWRYSARLLTSNFTATNWSQLTEGIPVFTDSTNDVNLIGNNPDIITSKVNNLKLTNNVAGLYTYVEIAALNYINDLSPYGYIIGRFVLTDDTIQFFNHSGLEPEQLDLDVATLNDFSQAFIKAQNVELLDNRAILSNLTPAQTLDFSDWVKTFKYTLNRHVLTPVGNWSNGTLQVGEYQNPMNVYSYKSHMMMETYRYGFRFKLKNGSLTQVFYPGYDIKIDLPSTLPSERNLGTFTTFDLTSPAVNPGGPDEVYSIYISWENINLSSLIDGVPAYDLIDEIIPCRATVVPEVLLHGNAALGVSGAFNKVTSAVTTLSSIAPYPFISGDNFFVPGPFDIYPGFGGTTSFTSERKSLFIYSPDLYFDLTDVDFRVGDEVYCFGNPTRYDTYTYVTTGIVNNSYYSEYDGYSNINSNTSPYVFTINPGAGISNHPLGVSTTSTTNSILLNSLQHRSTIQYTANLSFEYLQNEKNLTCRVSTDVLNVGPNNDYGFYRIIYYRPKTDKYGDPISTKYTEFLSPFRVGDNKSIITSGDFISYGDCFTQKSYLKFRYPGWWSIGAGNWFGAGASVGFYSQNRNNIQLRCAIDEQFNTDTLPTQVDIDRYISFGFASQGSVGYTTQSVFLYVSPSGRGRDAQLFYNKGYTPTNGVITQSAFNPLLEYQTDWGNAIAWSDSESEGTNTDNLRNFPPLNLKFLDYTQGPITDARALNGELYTIQNTEIQRQYFNSTAMTTTTGGEVYLGTGAVLSRRGTTMNKFGSRHKWSIIMGLSDKGGDVLYGIDDINNTVWRLGYDGTNSLDEIQGMKSFFANNLDWISGKYTPANDEGIRGVANQRYREVIWTLRGRKQYPEWQAEENVYYSFGFESNLGKELVSFGNFASTGSLNGWESLDTTFPYASNLAWGIQYVFSINSYAAETASSGLSGLLGQTTPIPFVAGKTYLVTIDVPIAPLGSIGVAFQLGGPYTTLTTGLNTFNYVALPGDDNIYLYSDTGAEAYISSVSVKEVLNTNANWTGSPNWILSNNEACSNSVASIALVQDIADYITPNVPWTLEFEITNWVSGDFRVKIGNVTSPNLGISGNGIYTYGNTPTGTGVIEFRPVLPAGFEGCIKGNVKLYSTGVLKEYNTGDIVQTSGYGTIMSTWSQTPDIWVCLKDNVTSNPYSPPDPDDPDWELIPHTNPNYYTEYTIVYNELKNKFQTFMSILPRIYAHFQNGYLVPRPISNTGRVYEADKGDPTTWFDTQTDDAFIEPVINAPAGRKRFLAARVETDVAPTTMDVTTLTGTSTTFAAEFEQREGNEFDGYVKDTSSDSILQGDFAVFRFTIAATTYNRINSFIASVRERARKWFK
jgi:hypothetical protein